MHGGKGSGALKGNINAMKHGGRSKQVTELAGYLRAIEKAVRKEQDISNNSEFSAGRLAGEDNERG